MRMKQIVFAFGSLLIALLHVIKCTNFTIIHDQIFHIQLNIFQDNSLWLQNTTFITVDQQNQSNIWGVIGNLQQANDDANSENDHVVYLMFTTMGLFYKRLLFNVPEERKINFATSADSLDGFLGNTLYTECLVYSTALKRSIVALLFSLFLQDVAIVTENTNCSIEFYKSLEKELVNHPKNNEINFKIYHVTFRQSNHPIGNRSSEFYHLKTIDISLLIPVVSSRQIGEVYKQAEHFGLLMPPHLWLVPGYTRNQQQKRDPESVQTGTPTRMMTFDVFSDREKSHDIYNTLSTSLPALLDLYERSRLKSYCKELNLREVSFCIKTKLYIKLFENERLYQTGNLELDIRYRDMVDSDQNWIQSSAQIVGEDFSLRDYNNALLRSVKKKTDSNEENRILRVVTVLDEPYSLELEQKYNPQTQTCAAGLKCRKPIITNPNSNNVTYKTTCCSGYVIEFFELLLKDLNIDIDMYLVADNKYGALEEGRWDGLIGDVSYGKADIAVGGISISGERSKAVDFTSPWVEVDMGVLVKPNIMRLDFINFEFIAALKADLQLALWVTFVGFMVVLFTLENCVYFVSLTRRRYATEKFYSIYECITYMGGITFQRDLGGIHPVQPGARISSVVFAFGMMVVVTTYTALLVEGGVNREEKDPFLGTKDTRMRNPTKEYKFATSKSTMYEAFFHHSESDVFRRISVFMKNYNVKSTEEAVEKIKEGSLNAYIYDYDFLLWYVSRDQKCELRVQKDPLIQSGLGFAFRKKSRWLSNFNNVIFRYRGSDEIQNLHKKWFFNGGCKIDELEVFQIQLAINNFGGYILLLLGTTVGCFLMIMPEHLYFGYFRNKISEKVQKICAWCENGGSAIKKEKKYRVNNDLEREYR